MYNMILMVVMNGWTLDFLEKLASPVPITNIVITCIGLLSCPLSVVISLTKHTFYL